LFTGPDGAARCRWCGAAPEFLHYHDSEWGFPVADDSRLFEKICLEGFQSGLSWRTILAKRENFRRAFHGFDIERVARYTERDVERLLADEGIVRHRGKIEAVINNARRARELIATEGSLARFLWKFEAPQQGAAPPQSASTSPEAIALARQLKKLGWKFVGPTTVYAFMQAMGLVNDHVQGCVIRKKVERARAKLARPS
jgi:DNA-3-methyladenine glycosylase I